jgi:hypothetical protein
MAILLYLLIPIALAGIVLGIRAYGQRRPKSIEDSLKEFQRGLDALDPNNEAQRRKRGNNGG